MAGVSKDSGSRPPFGQWLTTSQASDKIDRMRARGRDVIDARDPIAVSATKWAVYVDQHPLSGLMKNSGIDLTID